jgi:hypothetical protein
MRPACRHISYILGYLSTATAVCLEYASQSYATWRIGLCLQWRPTSKEHKDYARQYLEDNILKHK